MVLGFGGGDGGGVAVDADGDARGQLGFFFLRADGELDGVNSGFGAEVVHAGFQAALPRVEVHGGELAEVGVFDKEVHALALADERAPVGSHVNDDFLGKLPHGFVKRLDIIGDGADALHGAVGADEFFAHFIVPHAPVNEVLQEVFVHHHELARECSAGVDVAGVGFETFVVAEDLGGGGGGHGRDEEAVADAVLFDVAAQRVPVPAVGGLHIPHIELQDAFARG